MKRYIKSGDSPASNSDAGDLHSILLQAVMSWESRYLATKGVKDPNKALGNYNRKSGDNSYMTKVMPMLKTFVDKEKAIMDKIAEFDKVEKA